MTMMAPRTTSEFVIRFTYNYMYILQTGLTETLQFSHHWHLVLPNHAVKKQCIFLPIVHNTDLIEYTCKKVRLQKKKKDIYK
jgi:hypothetical protein